MPEDFGEEIDIAGPDPAPKGIPPWGHGKAKLTVKEEEEEATPTIDQRIGDLTGDTVPGMTPEQLLDLIVTAPTEKLIPWEDCQLPSRGLWYGWGNDGHCRVRAMGQAADKALANQRLAQTGQAIDGLFNECVQLPSHPDGTPFDPLELLAGDRIFLLYYLRGITHGNIYEFAISCSNPECEAASTHAYDINELAQTIVFGKEELGPEPFKIVLPYLSRTTGRETWVGVRWLRGRDATNMLASRRQRKKLFAQAPIRAGKPRPGDDDNPFARRRKQMQQRAAVAAADDTLTENLDQLIVSFMGVTDRMKIQALIARLHSTDTAAIREWLRDNTPGIETMVTLSCPECSNQFTVQLPITESFFRPTQPGRKRR
jgi:hypothetical protein